MVCDNMKKSAYPVIICIVIVLVVVLCSIIIPKHSRRLSTKTVTKKLSALEDYKSVWSLFEKYEHTDIGSGNYVYEYTLTDGCKFYIAGPSLDEEPLRVYYIDKNNTEHVIYEYSEK